MKLFIYIAAALVAYLAAGINPAIEFSKRIYKQDIRTLGSGNPGFTNFKRSFGMKWGWLVMLLDLTKAAIVTAVFAYLFKLYIGSYALGAAYTCMFAMLGHVFPVWYSFKGGKGFLVYMSVVWFIDWRAGLCALGIMVVLLLVTKFMSLATVVAMLSVPMVLVVTKAELAVILISVFCSLFMAIRHSENFKRLIQGTEKKFSFSK